MNQPGSPLSPGLPPAACIYAWELAQAAEHPDGFQTPFGTFPQNIYLTGTLTEKIARNQKISALRVSDPTGVFQISLNWQNTTLMQQTETLEIPSFITVFGTVRFRRYAGTTITEIQPELIRTVDRTARDQWLRSTAESALQRLEQLPHTPDRHEFAGLILRALENIKDKENQSHGSPETTPALSDEQLLGIITELSGKKGAPIADVIARTVTLGMTETAAKAALARLMEEGECYTPTTELIKVA